MTNDGTNSLTYDNNGNMTLDGTQASIWDGANRLKSMGGHSYAYDGLSNRISQTVNSVVTEYLLDVQPGLTKVIGATTSGNTDRYVHAQRGIHAMEDSSGNWTHPVQDGLSSVRMELSDNLSVNGMQILSPFGVVESSQGAIGMPFGFTGEMADANGLNYHRARYYNPETGTFTALDPMELLNRYSYVSGNPVNATDPTGMQEFLTIPNSNMPNVSTPIDWDMVLEDTIRAIDSPLSPQFEEAIREALEKSVDTVTDELVEVAYRQLTTSQALMRFGAAGIIVSSLITTTEDGRMCTPMQRAMGGCDYYWSRPETYQGMFAPQLSSSLQQIDDGFQCLPLPALQVPPFRTPPRVQTNEAVQTEEEEHDCAQYRSLGNNFNFRDGTVISDYDQSYRTGIVYRGLAANDDPSRGLVARAPGLRNISPRNHNAGEIVSPWISTGKDHDIIANSRYGNLGTVAINLDLVDTVIVDLSAAQGLAERGMYRNAAIFYKEVVILDCIPREAVIG